jgi:hypothetical protein
MKWKYFPFNMEARSEIVIAIYYIYVLSLLPVLYSSTREEGEYLGI